MYAHVCVKASGRVLELCARPEAARRRDHKHLVGNQML